MPEPSIAVSNLLLERQGRVFASVSDFALLPGQTLALMGASGSGKTTALMALAGIRPPSAGRIVIGGVDPWGLSTGARDRFRGRGIGLVFQTFHLVDALNVEANVLLAARCAGKRADGNRIKTLLDHLDLWDLRHRRPAHLSHGQAQRVAMARALVNGPAVVIADEPTSALDDGNAQNLLALLLETARENRTALVVATHDRRILSQFDFVHPMGAAS